MPQYRLPDGFTVTARGEADTTWNGFPVPILALGDYLALVGHLLPDDVDETDPPAAILDGYHAPYVDDGKVTPGYYCDGLQWEIVTD